jgi:hypothetical protein
VSKKKCNSYARYVLAFLSFILSSNVSHGDQTTKLAGLDGVIEKEILSEPEYSFLKNQSNIISFKSVGNFSVYSNGFFILYVKNQCADNESYDPFFLHVYPSEQAKQFMSGPLSDNIKIVGFSNMDFSFTEKKIKMKNDGCFAVFLLPEWQKVKIQTGQFSLKTGVRTWDVKFDVSPFKKK